MEDLVSLWTEGGEIGLMDLRNPETCSPPLGLDLLKLDSLPEESRRLRKLVIPEEDDTGGLAPVEGERYPEAAAEAIAGEEDEIGSVFRGLGLAPRIDLRSRGASDVTSEATYCCGGGLRMLFLIVGTGLETATSSSTHLVPGLIW